MAGDQPPVVPSIVLAPIGKVSREALEGIVPLVEERFPGRVCHIAGSSLPLPSSYYAAGRRQFRAGPLLDSVASLPVEAERVLGVVDADLFVPGLNFVFGLAQLNGRAGVISLARLRPEFSGEPANPRLFLERATKEAVHELGHTYGLEHCDNPMCVMHYSNNLEATDFKSDRFCPKQEPALQRTLGLLPPRRFRA